MVLAQCGAWGSQEDRERCRTWEEHSFRENHAIKTMWLASELIFLP